MGLHQIPNKTQDFQRFLASHSHNTGRAATSALKRSLDILLASIALVFLAPFMLPIAFLIKRHDGGPALFVQERIGLHGEVFRCYKFRSMVVDAQAQLQRLLDSDPAAREEWERDQKLKNDPRITRLGAFLRKTSLDELPQLLNILKGEMSIVGPRPIVRNEIAKYGADFTFYSGVRPGLTGLWQVSGRSNTTYDERVALDVRYVQEWTFLTDVKIIAQTVPAILLSKGAR